jgi:S-adenosylmethionine synthetase
MATDGRYLFTSESVTMGHPDKVADQVSDAILDAILAKDPAARVACETFVTTGLCFIAGEVTTKATVDYAEVARATIKDIGYTDATWGFDGNTCGVMTAIQRQSPDIAMGVDEGAGKEQGAGDQGLMFGYAIDETPELMPLAITLAHRICERLADARQRGEVKWLRPDGKSQVTVEYDGRRPVRVHTVVVSTQHAPEVSHDEIKKTVIEKIVKKVVPADLLDAKTIYHVNPTGRFVIGGPMGDTGLTGRKIIVDSYGGSAPHGGGAFSGKDPSKVDRSAAYMGRYIAKNVVAAGLAAECLVQVAYAIGVADPVSIHVDTKGTGRIEDAAIARLIAEHFPLKPRRIIDHLDLRRPIYRETARHGHFGRALPGFTWEVTDKADALRSAAGLAGKARLAGAGK